MVGLRSIHSEDDAEGDERVLGKLFALSSVTCISSCWIFRADSRDSLASFRQASHIVEIVPTVETNKVPPEINMAGLSHESSWGPKRGTHFGGGTQELAKEENAGYRG